MFQQIFKNIDDVLWKEAGCSSELGMTVGSGLQSGKVEFNGQVLTSDLPPSTMVWALSEILRLAVGLAEGVVNKKTHVGPDPRRKFVGW